MIYIYSSICILFGPQTHNGGACSSLSYTQAVGTTHQILYIYIMYIYMSKKESQMVEWTSEIVLIYDTRPASRLCNFQLWLQFWHYHYYLLIWRCLSNYGLRYLCAYIKSHWKDVFLWILQKNTGTLPDPLMEEYST